MKEVAELKASMETLVAHMEVVKTKAEASQATIEAGGAEAAAMYATTKEMSEALVAQYLQVIPALEGMLASE